MKTSLLIFLFFLPVVIFANHIYEPKLADYYMEKDQVNFKLDNGWVFTGEVPNQNMLYVLDRLIGMRVRIQTFPESPFLDISFENPTHVGCDKISFLGYVTEETYKQCAIVTDIEVKNSFFFPEARVSLSDGSCWIIKYWYNRLSKHSIGTYWSIGDHIIVTKKYVSQKEYSLVNLDVSGYHYVDYYKDKNEHWYSMCDARTVEAVPFEQ